MNILMIGGSHGIGHSYYKRAKDRGDQVKVLSRTQCEVNSEDWTEFDVMKFVSGDVDMPKTFETIDSLIYLPGSVNLGLMSQFTADDFIDDFKLNVVGAFLTVKSCLNSLKKSDKASVTLMSSVVAQTGMALHSVVGASKGGLEGLTRNLAAELAPKVRVNALALSLTDTPLTKKITGNEKTLEASKGKHPLKRIGSPDEVADMIQVLTHFSPWITGQVLNVDGGISAIR